MADPANDLRAVRPEVVLLLLDTGQAAGGIDDGTACHAGGRLLDPRELALIKIRTPAAERAVAALIDAGWQRWHLRSEALAGITDIIGEASPLARAEFDATLWACAVPRDLAAMTPREYAGWLDAHAALTARVTALPRGSGTAARNIHGEIVNLTIDGVDIWHLVSAGLGRRYPDWPKMPCVSVLTVLDRAWVIVIAGSQGDVTCCRTAWRSAAVRSV